MRKSLKDCTESDLNTIIKHESMCGTGGICAFCDVLSCVNFNFIMNDFGGDCAELAEAAGKELKRRKVIKVVEILK